MDKKELTVFGFIVLAFLILTNFKGIDTNRITNKVYLKSCLNNAITIIKEDIINE